MTYRSLEVKHRTTHHVKCLLGHLESIPFDQPFTNASVLEDVNRNYNIHMSISGVYKTMIELNKSGQVHLEGRKIGKKDRVRKPWVFKQPEEDIKPSKLIKVSEHDHQPGKFTVLLEEIKTSLDLFHQKFDSISKL